ncbi:MAG: hypothetical protein V3V08_03835 [Nannocystaceae bacterium]
MTCSSSSTVAPTRCVSCFGIETDTLGERVRKLACLTKHLQRLLYGRRSEKLTQEELAQLSLAFGGEGCTDVPPTPAGADERDEDAPEKEAGTDAENEGKSRITSAESPGSDALAS